MTTKLQTLLQDFRQTMIKLKTPFLNPIANIYEWKIMLEDPNFEFPEKFVTSWQSNKESAFDRLRHIHNLLKSLMVKYTKEGLPTDAIHKAQINLFRVWPLTLPLFKLPDLKDPHQDPIRQFADLSSASRSNFWKYNDSYEFWSMGIPTCLCIFFSIRKWEISSTLLREMELSLELNPSMSNWILSGSVNSLWWKHPNDPILD